MRYRLGKSSVWLKRLWNTRKSHLASWPGILPIAYHRDGKSIRKTAKDLLESEDRQNHLQKAKKLFIPYF
jgi:hypothetical protein